ncbi:MAG: MarR family transcriptional regulator [Oscillospiraceae bacterium]|nr:MarR family transcriptional regulator [Oscillospiraceae bacterium]MBR0207269.1 MarR family transcriptional regulator [Oscillospiraceae bacterium]
MDQTDMPIGAKFAVIHRAFRRELDASLREKELTGAQFGALRALDRLERERGGEISQRDVEELCRSAHPTMTEILKKLEKKGFIEARPSETDRRRKLIRRTDKARELDRAAFRADEQTYEKFAAGLDAAQRASLESMLDLLIANICGGGEERRV